MLADSASVAVLEIASAGVPVTDLVTIVSGLGTP